METTTMNTDSLLFLGFLAGAAIIPVLWLVLKAVTISVRENETALVRRFGRLSATIETPGIHVVADRMLPWVHVDCVSRRLDYRHVADVVANDVRGTTVIADVWIELRVVDPVKARFEVEDWSDALTHLVRHSVTSIFGRREFEDILSDRRELAATLQNDISDETARWGIVVEHVFLKRVSVLPEVAEQLFRTVAARLERKKADIDEEGHQRVALLQAETAARTARLEAEAKGQYAAAVGRALEALRRTPSVFQAYEELYALTQLRPHRTTAFRGFGSKDINAVDAAMLAVDVSHGAGGSNGGRLLDGGVTSAE
jgi:regulator of protease activity HflC (stomatin/prohibitin superfamily)